MATQAQVAPKTKAKAKAKATALGAAPKEVGEVVIALDDISLADDSGWRAVSRRRVEELKADFLNGLFGMNVLKKPSVLQFAGKAKHCMDGRVQMADGKHTLTALVECKALWENDDENDKYEWTTKLVECFEKGLSVSVLEFEDDDPDLVLAWATSSHDTESNKYRATSMKDLVKVALNWHAKTPGNSWADTQKKLETLFGKARRMFTYRMVTAAVTIPSEVLDALDSSRLPNAWIHDNTYFVGQGQDLNKRLSTQNRIKVIEIADQDLQCGRGMSAQVFQNEYCRPYKEAEKWIRSTQKTFGQVANIPSFERVAEFLFTSKARVMILGCLQSSVKLDGLSDQ